jgi:hypothetical protein
VSFTGQLIFIQQQYLTGIAGITSVKIMGGLIFSPKTQDQRDIGNFSSTELAAGADLRYQPAIKNA